MRLNTLKGTKTAVLTLKGTTSTPVSSGGGGVKVASVKPSLEIKNATSSVV